MTPPARMIFTDPPYNVPINGHVRMVLFKCLLIGQWHGLSDPNLERALKVRLDFMLFCGLDLHAPVPDETTHCRFRNALVKGGVHDDLLAEVCRQIEDHGLKPKEAEAAIIDATLVTCAVRPGAAGYGRQGLCQPRQP